MAVAVEQAQRSTKTRGEAVAGILAAISVSHLLNDTLQSLIPSIYPILKSSLRLELLADRADRADAAADRVAAAAGRRDVTRPAADAVLAGRRDGVFAGRPAAAVGRRARSATISGRRRPRRDRLVDLPSRSHRASRGWRRAGGTVLPSRCFRSAAISDRRSVRCCAAFVVVPHGQASLAWCAVIAVVAMVLLLQVGHWSAHHRPRGDASRAARRWEPRPGLSRRRVIGALLVLAVLIFSKLLLPRQPEQLLHLLSDQPLRRVGAERAAAPVRVPRRGGGGNDSRRTDRRSHRAEVGDLGIDPRRLPVHLRAAVRQPVLDRRPERWLIGLILASAFSAILVYAQELVPGRVGTIGGIFFGFAFGMGGLGAAALGRLADATSIEYVYRLCAYLPLIGLLTAFLPDLDQPATAHAPAAPVP